MDASSLPEPTHQEPRVSVELDGVQLTLIGTAHVSRASATAVRDLIAGGNFDAVALELCPNRYRAIVEPQSLADMDLFRVIRTGQAPMIAASLALGAFQQRIAEQFGIEPGAEMRAAIEAGERRCLPIWLIDRDVGITLKRVYRSIPWWQRLYLLSALGASVFSREQVSEEEVEALKRGDVLESAFSEFAASSAALFEPLITERDEFMAARLAQETQSAGVRRVLAVVGAGHLRGIPQWLARGIERPSERIEALSQVPSGGRLWKWLPWVIVIVILLGFALGFSRSSELGLDMVRDWVLINGGLAALGAGIAGGHLLTVLSAFLAAPLTSLNPTVGAGMVTAAVELLVRRPKVGDFGRLRQDTTRFSGWRRNGVARAFLVFILASAGSAVGTYVAGFRILSRL